MPARTVYVTPFEYGIVKPVWDIADYMKKRLGGRVERVSDHQIARIFPVLEDLARGEELKTTAIAKVMALLERHFGFENEEEKRKVEEAVATLVDKIVMLRSRDPIRVFKLVRSLRLLLIGFVRGRITLPISVLEKEKQSEKTKRQVEE